MGYPYDTRAWRELPREGVCAIHALTGAECSGALGLHHARPMSLGGDPDGPLVLLCRRHHPQAEALSRRVWGEPRYRRCPHRPGTHRYPGAKEACERQLNRELSAA